MKEFSVATLNVNRGGAGKFHSIHECMLQMSTDILAIQELDLNSFSCASFTSRCNSLGLSVSFSELSEKQNCRVALISCFPLKPVRFCNISQPDRYSAGIVEIRGQNNSIQKLLIISLYGAAGDDNLAGNLVEELVQAARSTSSWWIIVGDFNLVQFHHSISDLVATGQAYLLDDSFGPHELLPKTGRGRCRRVDFGIASPGVFPSGLAHFEGIGDHLGVQYSFHGCGRLPGFTIPSRPLRTHFDESDVHSNFNQTWNQCLFDWLLSNSSIDSAWTLLSDVAETCLCEPQASTTKRSASWKPIVPSPTHKAAKARESFILRRLRRFVRRFRQLQFDPENLDLQSNLHRDFSCLSGKFHAINEIFSLGFDEACDLLDNVVDKVQQKEKARAIAQWQSDMRNNDRKPCSWVQVKSNAVLQFEALQSANPVDQDAHLTAVHPAQTVKEACVKWIDLWTKRTEHISTRDMQQILMHTPGIPEVSLPLEQFVSPSNLQARCKLMTSKAPGADAWEAKQLLLLPQAWWDAISTLWCAIIRTSCVPERWKESLVVMIPKPDGGTRPLCLTSTLWRIGASCLAKGLQQWASHWQDNHVLGGLSGRGTLDAHLRLQEAARCKDTVFISEDLAKFFDCVDIQQACVVLSHLGAPAAFCQLLGNFYHDSKRLFVSAGICNQEWKSASRGLMQGCPFSPIVAASLMKVWANFVCNQQIDAVVYLDDRTFWNIDPEDTQVLFAAKHRSDLFDKIFGFSARPEKCHVAADPSHPGAVHISSRFGYTLSPHLRVLGVLHCVGQIEASTLSQPNIRKAEVRLRFIEFAPVSLSQKRNLIKTLVLPCITWCAGIAEITNAQLAKLRKSVLRAFTGRVLIDTPACIKRELLGWSLDPTFACLARALQFAVCVHTRRVLATDRSLYHLPWPQVCIFLKNFLLTNGWWWVNDGAAICRTDSSGNNRIWKLGQDKPSIILEWIADVFRLQSLRDCKRITGAYRRPRADDTSTAVGLTLPTYDGNGFCLFAGHLLFLERNLCDRYEKHAAFATGCSLWTNLARRKGCDNDLAGTCLCGNTTPSRPHLTWACQAFDSHRTAGMMPANCVEERLFARLVTERPQPPVARQLADLDRLVIDSGHTIPSLEFFFLATDGSEQDGVAAWGLFIPQLDISVAQGLSTEDQTAFRAEVDAISAALTFCIKAANLGMIPRKKTIVIISDCQAAIDLAQQGSLSCPLLACFVHRLINDLKHFGMLVQFCWVPSHGKQSDKFVSHVATTPDELRSWNAKADDLAKAAMKRRHQHSMRANWARQIQAAVEWECSAIHLSASIAKRYADYIAPLLV